MTAGIEGIALAQWIVTTLTGDPDLQDMAGSPEALVRRVVDGTWKASDDDRTQPPWWIAHTIMDPRDIKAVGMYQVMTQTLYQVKVVGPGESYAPLVPVYLRVHELLEARTNQAVPFGQVLTSQRVSGIQYPEQAEGMEYRHLGGTYEALGQ